MRGARPGAALTATLVVLLVIVCANAIMGGWLLVSEPSGGRLGLTPSALAGSPFSDFSIPGLALLALGALHGASAVLALRRRPAAGLAALMAGAALVLFIGAELLWLRGLSWFQPAFALIGSAELALGLRWLRATRPTSRPVPTSADARPGGPAARDAASGDGAASIPTSPAR